MQSAVTSNALSEKETFAPPELSTLESRSEKHHDLNRSKKTKFWLPACLIVLIISVTAAAVAVAMTFVLIAGLHSDLTAVMKDSSSGSGSKSYNEQFFVKSLESQIYKLNIIFDDFTTAVSNQVQYLNQTTSDGVEYLDQHINSKFELLRSLTDEVNLLTSSVNTLMGNITDQHNEITDNMITKSETLNNEVTVKIMEISMNCLETINILTYKLMSGIPSLHSFDSCTAVSNFSIQLPSGKYKIRSGDSTTDLYWNTAIGFSCHGIQGRWRRIALLSNNSSLNQCPMGFELINDSNVPAVCKRNPTGAGCSSITY